MPNRFHSRLLALALAACSFACAISLTGSANATQRGPHLRHRPFHVTFGHWRLPKRLRHKRADARRARRQDRAPRSRRALPLGGTSPNSGFDCSGLVYWAYGRLGIALPHSSYALAGKGRPVRSSRLRPGDLLFFYGFGHVGLYVGHGRMVHAPHAGERVQVVRLAASGYGSAIDAARRLR